jgi:hypothetical protein
LAWRVAVTLDPKEGPQLRELQLAEYDFWTRTGATAEDATELETPSVKSSPRVSEIEVGGAWLDHPRPKTSTFPAVTDDAKFLPQLEELQLALKAFWTKLEVCPMR